MPSLTWDEIAYPPKRCKVLLIHFSKNLGNMSGNECQENQSKDDRICYCIFMSLSMVLCLPKIPELLFLSHTTRNT